MSKNPHAFIKAGNAIYGSQWKNRLSKDLKLKNESRIRQFINQGNIPDGVWDDLIIILENRKKLINEAINTIKSEN